MSYKSKRSKATDISKKVRESVLKRDGHICIVCNQREGQPNMHYIRRSDGGLGIEENVVVGCIKCHHEFDNGSKREEIGNAIKKYLKSIYGDSWNEEKLKYNKWNGFKFNK